MTPLNGDFDDILRRALHAEVESVDPATDGLERILRRAREPWLLRQLSLMLTECADLFWLIVIRLEPGLSKLRQAIAARTGLLAAPAGRRHRPPARRARPRSRLTWIRPTLAVTAAVVVVVAGVYGLAQLRQSLVLDLFPNAGIPAPAGPAANGGPGPSVQGHSSPGAILPTGGGSYSARPSPRATCESAKRKPTPSPSTTPTPSPTGSSTGSPSPSPTATSPTPTTTSATTTAFAGTTSEISLAAHCERTRSSKSPSGTAAR